MTARAAALVALAACHGAAHVAEDARVPADAAATDAAADASPPPDALAPPGACDRVFHGSDPCALASVGAPGIAGSTLVCDVRAYGAVGDGVANDHDALQAAIDACKGDAQTGALGGTVVVPAGTYLTGMIVLGDAMVFHLDAGATLAGIVPANAAEDDADYPAQAPAGGNSNLKQCKRALVYAAGVTNLTIEADPGGTVNGHGDATYWDKATGIVDDHRPIALWTEQSAELTIRGLTIAHSAMWSFVHMEDHDVLIDGVTVSSPDPNERDGLDIIDSQRVCIRATHVSSEDDSICMKSGIAAGVADVHVVASSAHGLNGPGSGASEGNGLKLGTASYGAFANVCFEDITVSAYKEAAMAVESVDGAAISNVQFTGITFDHVAAPFYVMLGDRKQPAGEVLRTGSIAGVRFEHVTGASVTQSWGSSVSGTVRAGVSLIIGDVTFADVHISVPGQGSAAPVPGDPPEYQPSGSNNVSYPHPQTWMWLPAYGLYSRHATAVTFDGDIELTGSGDARMPIVTE